MKQQAKMTLLSMVLVMGLIAAGSPQAMADTRSFGWNPMNFFAGKETESLSTPEEKALQAKEKALKEQEDPQEAEAKPDGESAASKLKFWQKGDKGEERKDPAVGFQLPENQGAMIYTEKGNIYIEFYPDQAPKTVENFVHLVEKKFYDQPNMAFHRVVPGFVVQTGDPTGTGAGGSKERIILEAKNKLSHNAKGVVAMARSADPDSASSQFYITLTPQTALDGKYAIFGKVVSGLDVLDRIKKGDSLYGVSMVDLSNIPKDPVEKKSFTGSFKNVFAKKN